MSKIPGKYEDLLAGPVVVGFVTVQPDGQPQATPVWCKWDGQHIRVNTAVGRQKDENVQRNPQVTILAIDPENPYRYLEVRGKVIERTSEGALEEIDELAMLYLGREKFYGGAAPADIVEERVSLVIQPEHVNGMG